MFSSKRASPGRHPPRVYVTKQRGIQLSGEPAGGPRTSRSSITCSSTALAASLLIRAPSLVGVVGGPAFARSVRSRCGQPRAPPGGPQLTAKLERQKRESRLRRRSEVGPGVSEREASRESRHLPRETHVVRATGVSCGRGRRGGRRGRPAVGAAARDEGLARAGPAARRRLRRRCAQRHPVAAVGRRLLARTSLERVQPPEVEVDAEHERQDDEGRGREERPAGHIARARRRARRRPADRTRNRDSDRARRSSPRRGRAVRLRCRARS